MCCSSAPAVFSGTRIALIEQENGDHVMMYDNTARNLGSGPNSMLLLVPSLKKLGPKNVIDTKNAPHILGDMWEALRPRTRSLSADAVLGSRGAAKGFAHTTMGIYDIVLAPSAAGIVEGLKQAVPTAKRPKISKDLLQGLEEDAPGYQFVVACFNNRDAAKASPIAVRYTPANPGFFVFPAVDAHDGNRPRFDRQVATDHWLFAGSLKDRSYRGAHVDYSDTLSPALEKVLPRAIVGANFRLAMDNGDFLLKREDVPVGNWSKLKRGVLTIQ